MADQRRNLLPHAEAIAAYHIFGDAYAAQRGGSMDFWDGLDEYRKRTCREFVDMVLSAPRESEKSR
jgi:hypothetical protein